MPAPTMMTLGPAAAAREPCCATVSAARSNAAATTRALDVEELIFSNQCDMYYQCVYAYLFIYNRLAERGGRVLRQLTTHSRAR